MRKACPRSCRRSRTRQRWFAGALRRRWAWSERRRPHLQSLMLRAVVPRSLWGSLPMTRSRRPARLKRAALRLSRWCGCASSTPRHESSSTRRARLFRSGGPSHLPCSVQLTRVPPHRSCGSRVSSGVYTPAFALRGLAALKDPRVVQLALAAASQPANDVRLRAEAVRSLGRAGLRDATPGLLKLLDDRAHSTEPDARNDYGARRAGRPARARRHARLVRG